MHSRKFVSLFLETTKANTKMYSSKMNTIVTILIIQLHTPSLIAKDIEQYIAEFNVKGFPSSIIYEAISSNEKDNVHTIDKSTLSKYLESKQIQAKAIKIALQYAADKMKGNGNIRSKMDNMTESNMCDYSWIALLPWSGCPQNTEPEQVNKIELIKEQNYKCYKTKY